MATEVRVPTLGESVTEATVATWFKKPGEAVAVEHAQMRACGHDRLTFLSLLAFRGIALSALDQSG